MCVFLEYAGSWPAECAYFSSMEAPGKLDVRISRVLASWMCVFLESGGTWLVGHAYFSSLEAPDKLEACIS